MSPASWEVCTKYLTHLVVSSDRLPQPSASIWDGSSVGQAGGSAITVADAYCASDRSRPAHIISGYTGYKNKYLFMYLFIETPQNNCKAYQS
jgi:hypothetical protein